MKTHHQTIAHGRQTTNYTEMASHAGRHLRITITTDGATSSQSNAYAEILGTDQRWTTITEIRPGSMKTDHKLAYRSDPPRLADYAADATALKTETARLLEEPK